jgi:copper(I)-binding protein
MSIRTMSKKAAAATILTGAMLAASVATAAWLANGSGSGAGKALSAQGLTVEVATATADLYPGFTNGDLFLKINNPNPYQVTVTNVSRDTTPGAVVTSSVPACDTGGNQVSVDLSTAVSIVVPAGSSTTTSVADIVNMGATTDNTCQGATFTIPVTVSGASS